MDSTGRLVLIDFNVAQQKQWTTTSTVVGKHAYLPAEQFRGKPVPQSDLYAMGATLYFLFSGHDPQPISCSHPRNFDANVSLAFDDVVARLTHAEPEERFQTAEEARAALNSISSDSTEGKVVSILKSDVIKLNNIEQFEELRAIKDRIKDSKKERNWKSGSSHG